MLLDRFRGWARTDNVRGEKRDPDMKTPPPSAGVIDPDKLLTSGEELATERELAQILGVSRKVLCGLLRAAMSQQVRLVRYASAPWRYCVSDARTAIEPHRAAIEERRRKADELEAANRARAAARRAAAATRTG
jgi:hypothetical protein